MSSCPFCEMPPERVLTQDDLTLAIRDGFPVSPGHTLILPRRHIQSMVEATPEELAALLRTLGEVRKALDLEFHPDGYNVGINDGEAAGQTVMHLHLHLIPRFQGDVANPRGGVRHCIPGKGCYDAGRPS